MLDNLSLSKNLLSFKNAVELINQSYRKLEMKPPIAPIIVSGGQTIPATAATVPAAEAILAAVRTPFFNKLSEGFLVMRKLGRVGGGGGGST